MLNFLAEFDASQHRWMLLTTVLCLLTPFILTHVATSWRATIPARSTVTNLRKPPMLPYVIPWLGHILDFFSDGGRLLARGVNRFGTSVPFGIRLGPRTIHIISNPEMIGAFFKATRDVSQTATTVIAMEHAFGTPRKAAAFYEADDSGLYTNAFPESKTRPEDRIFYIIHKMMGTYLTGSSLNGMTARFQQNLATMVSKNDMIGDDWVELPDLYEFFIYQVSEAAIRSIFGDYILSLNPTMVQDFWKYDRHMRQLFMELPRWMIPEAYRTRDKMLENIQRWHKYAREHYDVANAEVDDTAWEPYFGSKFGRVRQATFTGMKDFNSTAVAAEDLGIIWASNSNAVPAAAWFLIETLSDSILKSRVQTELISAIGFGSKLVGHVPTFDVARLCARPLLQSIYAETLRLKVGVMVTRITRVPQFDIKGWTFLEGDAISCANSLTVMDKDIWSRGGDDDPHPLDEFWADRFILYPNDPNSGPLRKPKKLRGTQSLKETTAEVRSEDRGGDDAAPQFSLEGLANSWIPYGGGQRLCPGRHFAKQEIISSPAIMLMAYDIELTTPPGFKPTLDKSYYGFGTMAPKEKIPFRIRRRRA